MLAGLFTSRPKNRKRVEQKKLALPAVDWTRVGSALVGVAAVLGVALTLALALNRPVRAVQVAGSFQRVPALDVERVVRAKLTGGFVTANLAELQAAIEELPWVDHARVQRRWPDGLRVEVTEQIAAARWGASGLLNTRGELFVREARHIPPELPALDGPEGTEQQVADLYFQVFPRLLESGLRVTSLRLDARGAWELDLASGATVRFGRRQLDERVERFVRVGAPVVAGRPSEIAFVDMRYSNGFSVGWRTAAAAGKATPGGAAAPAAHAGVGAREEMERDPNNDA
jgi:cell division protein FtsQ